MNKVSAGLLAIALFAGALNLATTPAEAGWMDDLIRSVSGLDLGSGR